MGSKRPFEALVNSGNVWLSKTSEVKRRNTGADVVEHCSRNRM